MSDRRRNIQKMIAVQEAIEFIKTLSDNQNLRATVKGSVLGGVLVGVTATASSLLLGPIGLLIGGIAGGATGYAIAKDEYKPLSTVIHEMDSTQKEKLKNHLYMLMINAGVPDLLTLAALIASNTSIKTKIITGIISFLVQEFGIEMAK